MPKKLTTPENAPQTLAPQTLAPHTYAPRDVRKPIHMPFGAARPDGLGPENPCAPRQPRGFCVRVGARLFDGPHCPLWGHHAETGSLAMPVPMPAAVVLIVCKTVIAGPEDQNSAYTGAENREWATEHSMMVCRRQETQLYDQAEAMGAAPQPFSMKRCQRSGIMLGFRWERTAQEFVLPLLACGVSGADRRYQNRGRHRLEDARMRPPGYGSL